MKLTNQLMHSLFEKLSSHKKKARQQGKRSVALAQRGKTRHWVYGKHRSYCVATNRGVYKKNQ